MCVAVGEPRRSSRRRVKNDSGDTPRHPENAATVAREDVRRRPRVHVMQPEYCRGSEPARGASSSARLTRSGRARAATRPSAPGPPRARRRAPPRPAPHAQSCRRESTSCRIAASQARLVLEGASITARLRARGRERATRASRGQQVRWVAERRQAGKASLGAAPCMAGRAAALGVGPAHQGPPLSRGSRPGSSSLPANAVWLLPLAPVAHTTISRVRVSRDE